MTSYAQATVVPAIPPRPPQVSLLGSAILPGDDGNDPASMAPTAEQLAALPAELRAELAERQGAMWTRGFTYAPENHGEGWLRDRCDGTTIDFEALPAPSGLAVVQGTGGSLADGTYKYQVTAVNVNGETTPCALVTLIVTGGTGTASAVLTWDPVADGVQYRAYGRSMGSIGLIHIAGPFDPDDTPTYTDLGSISPGAPPPVSNTTGGTGDYSNPPINLLVPYIIEVMDTCSSWGWSERDFKGRALRWLENATPQAIEKEFWTGALAQAKGYPNNYLTNSASVTDLTPMTVPSVARGLQILQDALGQCGFGGQGMIHTQAQTAPNLLGARRVGKLLLDIFDNIIVPGVGYTGSEPGGDAPDTGTAYMYATDLVMVRCEEEGTVFPDTFSEALDRGQAGEPNTITFRAEKLAVAYFDAQCHFACEVNLAT